MKEYYVYILASKKQGVLYTGMTSDLVKRIFEHKSVFVPSFTTRYNVHQLVYYEIHEDVMEALKREKSIKAWRRDWKISLIEKNNPEWQDLYENII